MEKTSMQRVSFHDQISRNKWKSVFLMAVIFAVFIVFGYVITLIANPGYFFIIMIIAVVFSMVYLIVSYYKADRIALASVQAKPASSSQYPQYHHSVEALCLASGMPKPKLYVMKQEGINAFASGRNPENSVICVTEGALKELDKQELEGVLGHELSHIANYDIRFMTLTAVMVGMIAIISEIFLRSLWFRSFSGGDRGKGNSQVVLLLVGILLAVLAPIVTMLVQMAISRKREYTADASAVKFIRSPTGLVKALKKIDRGHPGTDAKHKVSKAVAPLFISDPFKKKMQNAFSTHPPLKKRIEVLERM